MGKLPSYLLWTVLQGAEKENNCRYLKLQKNKFFKAKLRENKTNGAKAPFFGSCYVHLETSRQFFSM